MPVMMGGGFLAVLFADQIDTRPKHFAVVDRTGGFLDVEAGVGFGMTDASDRFQLKLILSRDLNAPRKSQ